MRNIRRKTNKNHKKKLSEYNDEQQAFFRTWDQYFGPYNKKEAGQRWARNKNFDLLATNSDYEDRLYLLDWFIRHLKGMSKHAIWTLECGLIYVMDKEKMSAVLVTAHPSITRRMWTLNNHNSTLRKGLLMRQSEKMSKDNWARGGHWSYFHYGNVFFLKSLGYEVTTMEIAPGWWYNCGTHELIIKLKDSNTDSKDEIISTINEYRDNEITRIATRLNDVRLNKYKGDKIYDAPIMTDSNGVKWRP